MQFLSNIRIIAGCAIGPSRNKTCAGGVIFFTLTTRGFRIQAVERFRRACALDVGFVLDTVALATIFFWERQPETLGIVEVGRGGASGWFVHKPRRQRMAEYTPHPSLPTPEKSIVIPPTLDASQQLSNTLCSQRRAHQISGALSCRTCVNARAHCYTSLVGGGAIVSLAPLIIIIWVTMRAPTLTK